MTFLFLFSLHAFVFLFFLTLRHSHQAVHNNNKRSQHEIYVYLNNSNIFVSVPPPATSARIFRFAIIVIPVLVYLHHSYIYYLDVWTSHVIYFRFASRHPNMFITMFSYQRRIRRKWNMLSLFRSVRFFNTPRRGLLRFVDRRWLFLLSQDIEDCSFLIRIIK